MLCSGKQVAQAWQEEGFLHGLEAGESQQSAGWAHLGGSCVAFGEPRAHEQEKDMNQQKSGAGVPGAGVSDAFCHQLQEQGL